MGSRIDFYAGEAKSIARAVRDGEDPRKLKNFLGHVSFSFNLPPITSVDQLIEAIQRVSGVDLESFETALEEGRLTEDEDPSIELVDPGWVKEVAEAGPVDAGAVFDAWVQIMSEEEGAKIRPSPKLRTAVEEWLKLLRKAAAQKASVVHVWSI